MLVPMTFTVLDTGPAMAEILQAPEADRETLLRAMLAPAAGLYRYFPGAPDLVAMHRMGAAFPIDRDTDRCLEGLRLLREADAWTRVGSGLARGAAVLTAANPGIEVPDVVVLLVLGDPGDDFFLTTSLGMNANGSVTGYLYLNLWPTPENLARLEATAVHELHHNVRYAPGHVVWDPATVTVGEQVVSEGLAVTGMENFAAWVHGDAIAARFGATPVGLPTGAGYAAGNRLVDAYLAATGWTAADAVLADAAEVIDTALARLPAAGGQER